MSYAFKNQNNGVNMFKINFLRGENQKNPKESNKLKKFGPLLSKLSSVRKSKVGSLFGLVSKWGGIALSFFALYEVHLGNIDNDTVKMIISSPYTYFGLAGTYMGITTTREVKQSIAQSKSNEQLESNEQSELKLNLVDVVHHFFDRAYKVGSISLFSYYFLTINSMINIWMKLDNDGGLKNLLFYVGAPFMAKTLIDMGKGVHQNISDGKNLSKIQKDGKAKEDAERVDESNNQDIIVIIREFDRLESEINDIEIGNDSVGGNDIGLIIKLEDVRRLLGESDREEPNKEEVKEEPIKEPNNISNKSNDKLIAMIDAKLKEIHQKIEGEQRERRASNSNELIDKTIELINKGIEILIQMDKDNEAFSNRRLRILKAMAKRESDGDFKLRLLNEISYILDSKEKGENDELREYEMEKLRLMKFIFKDKNDNLADEEERKKAIDYKVGLADDIIRIIKKYSLENGNGLKESDDKLETYTNYISSNITDETPNSTDNLDD